MTTYLGVHDVLYMQKVLIDRYGGIHGIRDIGALESALARPQSGYYQDIIQQAAALMESLAINHPFLDGNKRIAFAVVDVFFRINGYNLDISSHNAYDKIMALFEEQTFDKTHLEDWLRAHTKAR